MTRPVEEQSLAELLASLASSIPKLVHDELELLKAQLAQVLSRTQSASALIVIATALTVAAVMLIVTAGVSGLVMLFASLGLTLAPAVALASLAAALVSAAIAALLVVGAGTELRRARQTIERGLDAVTGATAPEERAR